ncbi:hypothetical protein BT63DRAFT_451044 [Microthyrium microscopicum]|uniref:PQ loop repeat protein n=1 Tax=Microthyrium microscopicum TaxID=703497 RepID=A0A6A6UQ30_9PEZI|nr:hypothetical protein BT63DRAFT_451044 [Microthyrium microscopicum]
MAPQTDIPLTANVLGELLVPQIWKNWKRQSTEGATGTMFLIWAISCPPAGAYAIIQNFNIPIQIQPNILCALAFVAWSQTLFYHNKFKIWKSVTLAFSVAVVSSGVELLLVFIIQRYYRRGVIWPVTFLGIVSDIGILVGLIPPYIELSKRGGQSVGISFRFLAVDMSGALFSLLALAAQHTFDFLGGIQYILVITMETGIILAHLIWFMRPKDDLKPFKSKDKRNCEIIQHDSTRCSPGELEASKTMESPKSIF